MHDMSHRYFRNQHRQPVGGWFGSVVGIPTEVRAVSFPGLVGQMNALSVANGKGAVYEDEVAKMICDREPGFCWKGAGGGAVVDRATAGGSITEVRRVRASGCRSCGGGRHR